MLSFDIIKYNKFQVEWEVWGKVQVYILDKIVGEFLVKGRLGDLLLKEGRLYKRR